MTTSTVRSYKFRLEGKDQEDLRPAEFIEDLRPRVGDQIKIADFPTEIFKIVESIPPGSPAGVEVTYILAFESDRAIIAGGSIPTFPSYFLRTPWRAIRPNKIYY